MFNNASSEEDMRELSKMYGYNERQHANLPFLRGEKDVKPESSKPKESNSIEPFEVKKEHKAKIEAIEQDLMNAKNNDNNKKEETTEMIKLKDIVALTDEKKELLREIENCNKANDTRGANFAKAQIKELEIEIENAYEKFNPADETDIKSADVYAFKAMVKNARGKELDRFEKALLVPGSGGGANFKLPEGVSKKIHELVRDYKSLRPIVGYQESETYEGSFPVEMFETVPELLDYPDGADITEDDTIKFKNVLYDLMPKGGLFRISRALLEKADEDLIEYVARVFAKMAVVTENKMIIDTLNQGKTKVPVSNADDLKRIWDKELDDSIKFGAILLTNTDGYDYLEALRDSNGDKVLKPWSANQGVLAYRDRPVYSLPNNQLPTIGTTPGAKVPLYIGNLTEAVTLVDMGSPVIGFTTKNSTSFTHNHGYARIIEYIDVVQVDTNDKAYQVCEITL